MSKKNWEGKILQRFYLREHTNWDTYSWLSKVIVAALKDFKESITDIPVCFFESHEPSLDEINYAKEKWEDELNKMIYAFSLLSDGHIIYLEEEMKAVKDGLESFAKYFENLWN
jgi:DNA topoisomerase IA